MRKTTSLRLPEDLRDRLTIAAEQQDTTLTALMERYAREGLATDAHPGIVFKSGPPGRRAALAGGPDVWEIDATLPPSTCGLLVDRDHEAITPTELGAHNLADDTLIEIAGTDGWVVVTENAADFAQATSCTVVLVRKGWWPQETLAPRLAESLDRWARDHPNPGHWTHWLDSTYR